MKTLLLILSLLPILSFSKMTEKNLTQAERDVMWNKATERPFSGKYNDFFKDGVYLCKSCGAALYKSGDKFKSGCGWPAFDDSFPRAVKRISDADGVRTEIQCARCGAHLGHVFEGEHLTPKNVRHCVNSLSTEFLPKSKIASAVVAGGCFWGVEELMRKVDGVVSCVSGYAGGNVPNPSYRQVCGGGTGHLEAVEILFDKTKTSYSDILRRFFEIHDFTQKDGQGADIGEQYRSAIFYTDLEQQTAAEKIVSELKDKGYVAATKIEKFSSFYPAETYHQRYYETNGSTPYCHFRRKIF